MTTGHSKPLILVIATGGTVSMLRDPRTGKSVPVRTAADLLAQVPLTAHIEVRPLDFPDFTEQSGPPLHSEPLSEHLLVLARCLQREARGDLAGIVVTHGTDTLEEVAYCIDEVVRATLPIVFTGAMRPGWASGYDGTRNLENALRVAGCVSAEYGTLVTMNDEIFEAWSVYKADTGAPNAFTVRRGGPIGRIFGDQVELTWRPVPRSRLGRIPPSLPTAVPILMLGVADDAGLLDRLLDRPVQGVVIAGMAAGNVPPGAQKRVVALAEQGLPVVLCSSAASGRTAEEYYYPHAYDELLAAGVSIEDRLSPRKARVRLMISLGLHLSYVPFGREFVVTPRFPA